MRVKLIRPNLADIRSSDAMQPLGLAILAALTPADVELWLEDEPLESIHFEDKVDLVAITVETFTAKNAYHIADEFRRRGVPVVMGGFHPTFLPNEAAEHADAVVIGDAEGVWQQVIEDARDGQLRLCYRMDVPPALGGVIPDRRIYNGKKYLPLSLVQFGRGCRFTCDFCSIHAFYGWQPRQRPVREMVAEIEQLGKRHVIFVDDNLLADPENAARLFQALIPLKIRWSCQASIDMCNDPRLLQLMAASGCQLAMIGFESLNENNLQQMKKQWGLAHGDYADSIRKLQDHGIMIWGSFVLGYDHDTTDAFDITAEFAIRHKFFLCNFNPLTPMPGTSLYLRLQDEGRLLYERWWLADGYRWGQTVFRPGKMTADQLSEGCFRARRLFNSYRSMLSRIMQWNTNSRDLRNIGAYILGNMIMRREIHRKNGLVLGCHDDQSMKERGHEPLPV